MGERVLIVVAHPDDETVFFGGLTLDLVRRHAAVEVVCATASFGGSFLTSTRRAEFQRACGALGVRGHLLDLPDSPGGLPLEHLQAELTAFAKNRQFDQVFTHSVWGEYGHQHHSDVCLVAHRVFGNEVLSLAGPLSPQRCQVLSDGELESKRRIAQTCYYSQPFAVQWCTGVEGFTQVGCAATEAFHALASGNPIDRSSEDWDAIQELGRVSLTCFEQAAIPYPEVMFIPPKIWKPALAIFARRLRQFLGVGSTG